MQMPVGRWVEQLKRRQHDFSPIGLYCVLLEWQEMHCTVSQIRTQCGYAISISADATVRREGALKASIV